jgi:AraC-like DNA-binding protein
MSLKSVCRLFGRRKTSAGTKSLRCELNDQNHLSLRLARLKSSEEWAQPGEGLVFVFAKGGNGKYTSKTAAHRLTAGDIMVFDGAAGGRLAVADNKGEFLFWTFSTCFENLLPLFASREITFLHNITEGFKTPKIYPARSPLAADCQRLLAVVPPQFNLDHRGQLIRIAASILSLEFKEAQGRQGGYVRVEDHMTQVFEKLSASELTNLSVGELADRFSCSRRHLNRLFHQHFGVSVAALRMEMRLLKAVSLLRDPSAKIINVAEQCGFNHLGLFNTCFKRRFGTSPGQWRKSVLQSEAAPKPKTGKNKPAPAARAAAASPPEGSSPQALTVFASKIPDGADILEDLKRRDLLFGIHSASSLKGNLPEAGAAK